MAALNEAQQAVRQIRYLIEDAKETRRAAERDYQTAFGALSDAEASALLDNTGSPAQALRKAVDRHQQSILVLNARIAGLEARERAALADVDRGMRGLGSALDEWTGGVIAQAKQEYEAAMDQFVKSALGPIAVGNALGDLRLASAARSNVLVQMFDESSGWQPVKDHRQNGASAEISNRHSGVRAAVNSALHSARLLTAGNSGKVAA
jgi:hypothetical protein